MLYHNKHHYLKAASLTFLSMVILSGCAGKNEEPEGLPAPQAAATQAIVQDEPVKLGEPYQIGGKTYAPQDNVSYDGVGYASWYGQELAGQPTANGETFNPRGISAAHRTLPMPSYVEVTALNTGRTILVRINDRGPFSGDREIDLSQGAAEQLGISASGVAPVRVRRVNPTEEERMVLRMGNSAVERIETPESLLTILRRKLAEESGRPVPAPPIRTASGAAPKAATSAPKIASTPKTAPAPQPMPGPGAAPKGNDRFIVEESGTQRKPRPVAPGRITVEQADTAPATSASYVVQIAAFSDRGRAEALAKKSGAKVSPGGGVYRVRMGPYATPDEADRAAAKAKSQGYSGARVLRGE
jgi:rare lipoprotein A